MFDFQNRHVLITGGTSGIGRALAIAFRNAGANVLVTGVRHDEIVAFSSQVSGIAAVLLDVRNDSDIVQLAAAQPRLDVLVNCAGMILRNGAEFSVERFAEVVDVNLTGTMRLCSAFHTHLAVSRGCIVNVASMLSIFGSGFAPAYSSSKGAIAQLTKSLAIAWAPEGIRVNAVAPGWIETALTQPLQENPARREAITLRTPLGRWGKPEDLTGPVLFLCSPAAAFMTGVIMPVDGGYSVM
ncbi:MAG: short-chain dehydrogenase/reductase [Planctomycetaceae bacterium]|nr:short-chain dehydrogenase/reductase [Planctomycetaceae bacterium]